MCGILDIFPSKYPETQCQNPQWCSRETLCILTAYFIDDNYLAFNHLGDAQVQARDPALEYEAHCVDPPE